MTVFILMISFLLLGIVFVSISFKRTVVKKTLPENMEERFMQYCDMFLANIKIKAVEVKLEHIKQIGEVPFEDGMFEYYNFDFSLIPDKSVSDSKGIVLTTDQLLEKAGMKGKPVMLFFRDGEETYELSFVSAKEIARRGQEGYVYFRYANIKNPAPRDEYSVIFNDERIRLWENIRGNAPFEGAAQTRERNHDILSNIAQFSDTWEGIGIRISSWVQFERKLEMIYRIKITGEEIETDRGVKVGSSIGELKRLYPQRLAYNPDFKGSGPCYGFIPDDKSFRYIAFFVANGKVTEIWVTDGFDERPFEMPDGNVDDDVDWIEIDNSDKFSDRYAREIYVGQHKTAFDAEKVFHSFVAKELVELNISDMGEMKSSPGQKEYYIIGQKRNQPITTYVEVLLKRVKLLNSVTGDEIWVVDRYRMQSK